MFSVSGLCPRPDLSWTPGDDNDTDTDNDNYNDTDNDNDNAGHQAAPGVAHDLAWLHATPQAGLNILPKIREHPDLKM